MVQVYCLAVGVMDGVGPAASRGLANNANVKAVAVNACRVVFIFLFLPGLCGKEFFY